MAAILFVRIESDLNAEELDQRMRSRCPGFAEVPGLIQKIFGRDPHSGHICGIYFFQDQAALAAYRESDLAKSIPEAYAAVDVRRESYEFLYPVYPDRGPVSA